MSDLPEKRLPTENHFPFMTTGIALSLEPFTLSSQLISELSVLHCIRCSVRRRVRLNKLVSDNGTSFVSANKVLQSCIVNLVNIKDLKNNLQASDINIDRKTNLSAAPHFGGSWNVPFRYSSFLCTKLSDPRRLMTNHSTRLSAE